PVHGPVEQEPARRRAGRLHHRHPPAARRPDRLPGRLRVSVTPVANGHSPGPRGEGTTHPAACPVSQPVPTPRPARPLVHCPAVRPPRRAPMTRLLPAALLALLVAPAAAADDPASIFRFTEYAHPLPEAQGSNALALSPDGKLLAARGGVKLVVWEAGTGKPVARFTVPNQHPTPGLGFGADGKTLLTAGGEDKALRVWDLTARKSLPEVG